MGWCGLVGCRGGEGKGAEEGERKREIWREGGTEKGREGVAYICLI